MNQPSHDGAWRDIPCRRVVVLAAIGLGIFVVAGLVRCQVGFDTESVSYMFKIQLIHDITRQAMWLGAALLAVAGYGYIRPSCH